MAVASAATYTYEHTFVSNEFKTGQDSTVTINGVEWAYTKLGYVGTDADKGVQLGSSKAVAAKFTLSTSAFSAATITSVEVNASTANKADATLSVSVNGTALGDTIKLTTTATDCKFSGSATGGDLAISYAQTTEKGLYLKSIKITYEADEQIGTGEVAPTYVAYDNLKALIDANNTSDLIQITGDVTVVYQSDRRLYLQDDTAPMLVYGSVGATLSAGAKLSGIAGTYTVFNGTPEITNPVADTFKDATDGEAPIATGVTPAGITAELVNAYVKMEGVTVSCDSTNVYKASLDGSDVTFYNQFSVTIPTGDDVTVYGIVSVYGEDVQLYPISFVGGVLPEPEPEPEPEPTEVTGEGTLASPYTVSDVKLLDNPGTQAWVHGYIVGSISGQSFSNGSSFTAEGASDSNILLADEASASSSAACIPVQLPSGSIRNELNLKSNPGNLGKEIWIKGNLEAYFSTTGLKSPTEYTWTGTIEEPTYPTVATLSDWIDEQPEANTQITGAVTVVYQSSSKRELIITDGTASILIYGALGSTYSNGDQLTGIAGSYTLYQGMPEMVPVAATFANATEGTAIEPAKADVTDVNNLNVAKFLTITGEIAANGDNSGTTTDFIVKTDAGQSVIYNRYSLTIANTTSATMTGFVFVINDSEPVFAPITFVDNDDSMLQEHTADATNEPDVIYDLSGRRLRAVTLPGIYIVNGQKIRR
jgi:hypothetical protein